MDGHWCADLHPYHYHNFISVVIRDIDLAAAFFVQ